MKVQTTHLTLTSSDFFEYKMCRDQPGCIVSDRIIFCFIVDLFFASGNYFLRGIFKRYFLLLLAIV